MKLFVVVVILSAFAVAVQGRFVNEEEKAAFMAILTPCKQETGASDADVQRMLAHELAETKEGKCLVSCVMKKLGVMDANGKFVKDIALKLAEHHTNNDAEQMKAANKVVDACKDIPVSDDHCEASYQYKSCLREEAIKIGMTPI